ncbi:MULTISPECIES: chromosome segregation protein SMC [Streptococcus]|uniref:chromosome segregation protein SMC n=1 Tax=Streptococcus TaxID=1301 RepID=UPI00193478A5|nr:MULTISPECIES: chromosome segregation protein SMC [Streptococcus]MBM0194285.1 chromosome segregation protein SMC [Streptococcus suis]MBM7315749.1 chromosome segregation protein SMC [Streptococcus suis]MBY0752032.1 chromosome segregation protein SMC [Streptococcus sp. 2018037]HEM5028906.1 chromosome segregation protein SMC [Streptococcus suis]HEM5104015.1 chromosome segregation protein SMC [Streptococcus suis]
MYLKSIEMQGFKSFADKTKVVFDRGVTVVVGPNGSGKSNITESLRWALGESSAKSLRGGKMPDVIFSGTESRKALNYASVVVTLDNSTGFIANKQKEIKVERHIYRSGDSEYLIDGQKVRLRDIHDLFMDTGLGRDSFSIISQGRVEAIFNSKPEERRAIFEEAAGVLKYKTRKKETESKLAQAQGNLDRLDDIIYELDNQVKPLEKQAQTAKKFLELDGQRKELYLDVLVAQLSLGKEKLSEKEAELESVKTELTSYYKQRSELEQENQNLKEKRHSLSEQLEREQAVLLDLTKLISDLERKIEVHKLESSQNESSRQEAQARLENLLTRREQLAEQIEQKQETLAQLDSSLSSLKDDIAAVDKEISYFSEDPDQVLDHLREQYVALMQEEAEASNRLTKIQQDIANQISLSESKSEDLARLQTEKQTAQEVLDKSRKSLEEADHVLRQLLESYQTKKTELDQVQTAYQAEQGRLFDLLDQLKGKQARQSSLEAILKNHSNFYAGVKAVLQAAPSLGGIIGAVSEQLTFDTRYQTALEIALGGASQNVIVEDEATAKRAIAFLKEKRQGRATFLPLTTIRPRQLSGQQVSLLESSEGFLGLASDLVTYQPNLDAIFQNLLGTIAIFDTIDHANQAALATKFQVRMVTMDGAEIRPGGAFAGGSNRNNSTTFIKPELDALLGEIAELSSQLQEQESLVAAKKTSLDQTREALETIKAEGEEARLNQQSARIHQEQAENRLAQLSAQYDLQMSQVSPTILTELEEAAAKEEVNVQALNEKKLALDQQINQVRDNRDSIQESLQKLQTQKGKLTLEQAELTSQLRFEQTDLRRLQEEKVVADKEISLLEDMIDQKLEALEDTSIEILEEQLQAASDKQNQTNQILIRLKFELEDIDGQFEDLEERLQQARTKNDDLIRKQAKLEADCEQAGDKLRTLLGNLTEHFKLSFEAAQSQAKEVENLAVAEQSLKDLERAIRALGPVNLDAIEQYDEVNNRLTFLNEQRTDILSARDLLLGTIHEMDDEVKERFKVTFEAIRKSFKQTFKQMFGGGSADLILTEGDLLTAGVEISVQPPGKKIQSLNLMSGGEKALSALALLFSIIRVKTIPFVILDEVEAALDEANVKRFGDYLNRFDKESQFIVVTHRKGTMAAADAMYGVTMQESGVSKIVSVKLKDVEKL